MKLFSLRRLGWFAAITAGFVVASPSHAQTTTTLPISVAQAIVRVVCADRQGSGTVINGSDGYVLTNAHVVVDLDAGGTVPASCQVGFVEDPARQPSIFYRASILRWSFDDARSRDFAILQIGEPLTQRTLPRPFPFRTTNEFTKVGDAILVAGYSGANHLLDVRSGTIHGYEGGYIQTDAEVRRGDSGGAGLDLQDNLVGVPTRVATISSPSGVVEEVRYELFDVRAVMNWLDSFGTNEHDRFFTHADFARYHRNVSFIQQDRLDCSQVVNVAGMSAVYCLQPNFERKVFPNNPTLYSWFPDFSSVQFFQSSAFLSQYRLTGNVAFKPGTLVKVTTSPRVYVVVDSFGTLRWIPTEDKARELWGPSWSSLVHDVPDEFWTNYTVGQPLDV